MCHTLRSPVSHHGQQLSTSGRHAGQPGSRLGPECAGPDPGGGRLVPSGGQCCWPPSTWPGDSAATHWPSSTSCSGWPPGSNAEGSSPPSSACAAPWFCAALSDPCSSGTDGCSLFQPSCGRHRSSGGYSRASGLFTGILFFCFLGATSSSRRPP